MLLEALSALAAAGGGALVQAMATDAWQECRERTARLLGRGDPQEEARQEARLERAREELAAAGDDTEQVAARQAGAWRTRFEDLLEDTPEQAQQLRDLVAFVRERSQAGGVAAGQVTVHATASGQARQAVQGQGEQHNTFQAPR
ncbi:hypothetical protein ACFZAG_36685 [Streptomyces sp. NPDC012403]|uniref:hypothetical protein n=1 Tax=unclassified Streptomyces TaxID=2593676 RepID=UPI001C215658|nr:hypothetical protein [Streptomyces sp. AC558_RSS880]